jgi:hypothetical protein
VTEAVNAGSAGFLNLNSTRNGAEEAAVATRNSSALSADAQRKPATAGEQRAVALGFKAKQRDEPEPAQMRTTSAPAMKVKLSAIFPENSSTRNSSPRSGARVPATHSTASSSVLPLTAFAPWT